MLPVDFQVPAGAVLVAVGLLACFAGYRLFRAVLTLYGFVIGALFASTLVAPSQTMAMTVALVAGGVAGAAIMYFGYFVGVMLVGAGLGALAGQALWTQLFGHPNAIVTLVLAVVGAVVAVKVQRYVIVIGTAFIGAQTAVAGAVALAGARLPRPRGAEPVWVGHLGLPPVSEGWPFYAWIVLSVVGTLVQLGWGSKGAGRGRRG
ncbi:MAG TPA: DUF4203 domain-containing protein [Vicinamibacterales bacterium]|nr:DUF4203 domain-containing protein [Vicinamibacterales bacterium]